MERFLAPVALALLHSDGLRRGLDFDAVKVQLEATYLFQTLAGPDEYSLALELSVAGDLKSQRRLLITSRHASTTSAKRRK